MFGIWAINIFLVCLVVLVHYEMLFRLSVQIPKMTIKPRFRVILGLIGALAAHVIEIWVFALGYYIMVISDKFGMLNGAFNSTLMDCVYYSFVTYTSLGLGDIYPTGDIRFTTGLESLTGLVMITWSASFMFIEMQKFWKK